MPFMDEKPGPPGAESAGGSAGSVPPNVVNRFVAEGFKYVGRIRLARDLGPRPDAASDQPEPETDADGDWTAKAVRCTPEGDVYVGK